MVIFVSLFIGLVIGLQPVELEVSDAVARVELVLDGQTVSVLEGPPWVRTVDFGLELKPHSLLAVAYDDAGRVLDRTRQNVNLPRDLAEAAIVLEGGAGGRGVAAKLTWESVVGLEPEAARVQFDGRPLPVEAPRRFELPAHDPDTLHFLHVELDFPRGVTSVAELAFGGGFSGDTGRELTAVPLERPAEHRAPTPQALRGELLSGGEALAVAAVETGPAQVVFVRDERVRVQLIRLDREQPSRRPHRSAGPRGVMVSDGSLPPQRLTLSRDDESSLRLVFPFPEGRFGRQGGFSVFQPSHEIIANQANVLTTLATLEADGLEPGPQRITDAVAVAALLAADRSRRRAVVLIVGDETDMASHLSPASVRRFLAHIGVPLRVWTPVRGLADQSSPWGELIDISTPPRAERAVRELREALERQHIVWVEGTHLPNEIEVSIASSLRVAGR